MKIKVEIPKSWNELSDKQLLKLVKLLHQTDNAMLLDYRCFMILLDIRFWQFWKFIKVHYLLSQIPMREIKTHFSFIYTEKSRTKFPAQIKIKGKKYFPPLDKMVNLTANEFAIADDLHIKYHETKNIEYLRYLAATLYVEHQQPRPYFDKNNLETLKPLFNKVSPVVLLAIDLAYFGGVDYMALRFKHAFPKPSTKNSASKKATSKKGSNWPEVILKMAGGKFGNHEETKNTNVYTFLAEFNDNLKNPPKNE
jgi:hypothetical protein